MDARGLLLVIVAIALAVYGAARLERQQSPYTTGYGGSHASQGSIGVRNHSGIEPTDVFGFKQRGW